MLTDDDLTRQLGAAFGAASEDVSYTRPVPVASRTPSRRWLAVPAVAAAAAMVVVPETGDRDRGDPQPTQAGPETTDPSPQLVTERIRVAGFTLTYEREAGAPLPVSFVIG